MITLPCCIHHLMGHEGFLASNPSILCNDHNYDDMLYGEWCGNQLPSQATSSSGYNHEY